MSEISLDTPEEIQRVSACQDIKVNTSTAGGYVLAAGADLWLLRYSALDTLLHTRTLPVNILMAILEYTDMALSHHEQHQNTSRMITTM